MKTKYTQHHLKEKRLQYKLDKIAMKYPAFNFRDGELRRDLTNYWEIQKKLIYASVDAKACKSDKPDFMCEDCDCWKRTRANCM